MKYYWSSSSTPSFYELVHHTLAFGTFEDCVRLVKTYPKEQVRAEFLKPKKGTYSRQAFGFARLLLGVSPQSQDYVKTIS